MRAFMSYQTADTPHQYRLWSRMRETKRCTSLLRCVLTEKLSLLNEGSAKSRITARNTSQYLREGDLSGGNRNENAQAGLRRHAAWRQSCRNSRIRDAGCATAFGRRVERRKRPLGLRSVSLLVAAELLWRLRRLRLLPVSALWLATPSLAPRLVVSQGAERGSALSHSQVRCPRLPSIRVSRGHGFAHAHEVVAMRFAQSICLE